MSRPRVSDHAMLRFLERAGGLEVEALREQLEDALSKATTAALSIGAGDFIIKAGGMVFPVRNGVTGPVVTTVLPNDDEPGRRARAHWPAEPQ